MMLSMILGSKSLDKWVLAASFYRFHMLEMQKLIKASSETYGTQLGTLLLSLLNIRLTCFVS